MKDCRTCAYIGDSFGTPRCSACFAAPGVAYINWQPKEKAMAYIEDVNPAEPIRHYPPMPKTTRTIRVPMIDAPAARKDDSGKVDMTLFDDMPRALKAVAEVMQWAITKKQPEPYVRASWLGVEADRYRAAQGRHTVAQGEQASSNGGAPRLQYDHETGLLHEAHKACSALMALENILREIEASK
jgi:hypothetical protein